MSLGSKGREGAATRCSLTVGGNAQYKRQQQRHGTTNMTANGKQSLHIAQKEKNGTLTTTKPYMRPASAPKHKSTQERRLERCAACMYYCCILAADRKFTQQRVVKLSTRHRQYQYRTGAQRNKEISSVPYAAHKGGPLLVFILSLLLFSSYQNLLVLHLAP